MGKTVKTLEAARAFLVAQEGEGAVLSLSGETEPIPVIPSGSFLIDAITGVGGLPCGRIAEFYGPESSGKSTVLSSCAAQCQKVLKKAVLYLDYESCVDPLYMRAQGVDLSDDWFIYSNPTDMESGFRIAELMMESGLVGLVIVDSVAAMMTLAEAEGEVGNTVAGGMAAQARVMAVSLKKLVRTCSQSGCTLAFINQVRSNLSMSPWERSKGIVKETTPGGSALKFYSSLRVKFTKVAGIKGHIWNPVQGVWEDGIVATKVRAEVIKNKVGAPFRKAEFVIRYGIGIDDVMSLVLVGVERRILSKSAGYITIPARYHESGEDTKINGLEKVCNYFRKVHPDGYFLFEEDMKALISKDLDFATAQLYDTEVDEDVGEALLSVRVESLKDDEEDPD
jgi:recombination protein RecA